MQITTYDEAELNILRQRVKELVQDQEGLRKQLEESFSKDITDIKIEKCCDSAYSCYISYQQKTKLRLAMRLA